MSDLVDVNLGHFYGGPSGPDGRVNRLHLLPGPPMRIVNARQLTGSGWRCDIVAGPGSAQNRIVTLAASTVRELPTTIRIDLAPDTPEACDVYALLWELRVVQHLRLPGVAGLAHDLADRARNDGTLLTDIAWTALRARDLLAVRDLFDRLCDTGYLTTASPERGPFRLTLPPAAFCPAGTRDRTEPACDS